MKRKTRDTLLAILASATLAFSGMALASCGGILTHEHVYNTDNVCKECNEALKYTEGLKYNLIDGSYYELAGIGAASGDIVVPCYFNGLPVMRIAEYAFRNCNALNSIIIPNSVTSIERYAFDGCKSLESITIPDSVTSIGDDAFSYCSSLKNVVMSKNIETIGDAMFYDCPSLKCNEYDNCYYLGSNDNPYMLLVKAKDKSITSCVIHDKTVIIMDRAFYDCANLTDIVIPRSVNTIVAWTFDGCKNLKTIKIPNSVKKIYNCLFRDCENLTIYCEVDYKPAGWEQYWNMKSGSILWGYTSCPVVWGAKM